MTAMNRGCPRLLRQVVGKPSFSGVRQMVVELILVVLCLVVNVTSIAAQQPSEEANGQPTLFRLVRHVQVATDDIFRTGGFTRVGYVPATDRLVVVYGTQLGQPAGGCTGTAHVYREYNLDMQPTGNSGVLNCGSGDSGGVMVDNVYYDVSMQPVGASGGWRIMKFDAVTWVKLADLEFPLDSPQENSGDPMVAFVNGRLDVASDYTSDGNPPPVEEGAQSHHQFFSPDLEFIGERRLSDRNHAGGASLIYVDGVYYFVTASAFLGDLILLKYDQNWQYLGTKDLRQDAHWPTGLAFDGQRFYVAYLETSQRDPFYPNVHLAAFDREWNLVEDVAVTDFAPEDHQFTGRPWVILHGNRLYVSYDVAPTDSEHMEELERVGAVVSIYELTLPKAVFPQFVNGDMGGAPNRTRLILRNNSGVPESGKIVFQGATGDPTVVPVNGAEQAVVDFGVPPWGTLDLQTDGAGSLAIGSCVVWSNLGLESGLEGTEVFQVLGNYVSVDAAPPRSVSQVYVSVDATEDTGVAMYNPEKTAVTLNAALVDADGAAAGSTEITLQAGEQRSQFVTEMFATFFQTHALFKGTLNLQAGDGGNVACIGLIQKTGTGALIGIATSPNAHMPE